MTLCQRHDESPVRREAAIEQLHGELGAALSQGEVEGARAVTYELSERLDAHRFMLRLAERRRA